MVHPAIKPDDMGIGRDPNFSIIFEEMKRLGSRIRRIDAARPVVNQVAQVLAPEKSVELAWLRGRVDAA
jgi:hypothetical protein